MITEIQVCWGVVTVPTHTQIYWGYRNSTHTYTGILGIQEQHSCTYKYVSGRVTALTNIQICCVIVLSLMPTSTTINKMFV